ncbi:hypothetical protein [Streptomyces sp. KN37]|uniref:hypothetical protein n=1 Tax=Streptomyces sp. KN37 TaxID=3090667 RepID=UPI002A760389|nr:hypothetical protein [Streptomyces sp. KN37]WPO76704.1 hypothetical protein R9806_39450 [Streptomyces sp. KN37]
MSMRLSSRSGSAVNGPGARVMRARSHRAAYGAVRLGFLQAEGVAKVEVMPGRPVVVAGAGMGGGRMQARGHRLAYQLGA